MKERCHYTGFTLIEISLSLVFVTILALAITLIISNTIGAYQRGLTLNQVNTLGMSLTDDFRIALQNSSGKTLKSTCVILYDDDPDTLSKCENDEAFNFVSVTKYASISVKKSGAPDKNYPEVPIFGAFCTGSYSYLWNTGYFESLDAEFGEKANGFLKLKYKTEDGSVEIFGENAPFRLARVQDPNRAVCISAVEPGKYNLPAGGISNVLDITGIGDGTLPEAPENLISNNANGKMALYELLIARPALSTEDNSLFYSGSFILGTVGGGIDIMAKGKTCATPNDYDIENFDYCAINKFNFAVQASGE